MTPGTKVGEITGCAGCDTGTFELSPTKACAADASDADWGSALGSLGSMSVTNARYAHAGAAVPAGATCADERTEIFTSGHRGAVACSSMHHCRNMPHDRKIQQE